MEEYPVKKGNALAFAYTVWVFEPLNPIGELRQTAVSFTIRLDSVCNIPTIIAYTMSRNFSLQSQTREISLTRLTRTDLSSMVIEITSLRWK